jgi:hypothetical protein
MTCEEIMRKALWRAKVELAALLEDPGRYEASRWPVSNPADAECLSNAYSYICDALDDISQPTP